MFLNKAVRTNHINSVIIYIEDSIPFFCKDIQFFFICKTWTEAVSSLFPPVSAVVEDVAFAFCAV